MGKVHYIANITGYLYSRPVCAPNGRVYETDHSVNPLYGEPVCWDDEDKVTCGNCLRILKLKRK